MTKSKLRHSFRQTSSALQATTNEPSALATFGTLWERSQSVPSSVSKISVPPGPKPSIDFFSGNGALSRPTSRLIERLKETDSSHVNRGTSLPNGNLIGLLYDPILAVRKALIYDPDRNQKGLPPILLSRLSKELVDVLILFAMSLSTRRKWNDHAGDRANALFTPFVLHWLFFVADDTKAARHAFTRARDPNWTFDQQSIRELIREFESHRIARTAPSAALLGYLYQQVDGGGYELRAWEERFSAVDCDDQHMAGEALRVLSTSQELIKRALMWLQRSYIDRMFPHYDPTFDRDEDLPIDLDHLVPRASFNFDWCQHGTRLGKDVISDDMAAENFRWRRGMVGQSLGNFRWVAVCDNSICRRDRFEPIDDSEIVTCPASWNKLIAKPSWSKGDIASFQRLIDRRTLDLYKKLITDSAIQDLFLDEVHRPERLPRHYGV
jgi:hypothetical protein